MQRLVGVLFLVRELNCMEQTTNGSLDIMHLTSRRSEATHLADTEISEVHSFAWMFIDRELNCL